MNINTDMYWYTELVRVPAHVHVEHVFVHMHVELLIKVNPVHTSKADYIFR
jgi:hypothetical protein